MNDMETDEADIGSIIDYNIEGSYSAVNSSILDYYKKFGRKRDLEQFFSLSTTQSDIRDPTSVFWRRMKSQNDSSDSGENKKSESSTELCRISIQCSIPEPSTSQDNNPRTKMDSVSPPIISEDVMHPSRSSDNDSDKSNDVQSQKSNDCTLDTSMNKPISPTSSVTSQRKLEWDSLADVGYANESDRKNSASSLSTLERMALQQQYSNESKHNPELGPPTAQSTPLDGNDSKLKSRKSETKKITNIYKKDVDLFELSVPKASEYMKPINVNLTKHISFNVEKDGGVSVENMSKSISLSPEKVSVETAITPQVKMDKEIQTTLIKNKDNSVHPVNEDSVKRIPVLISLNTLKKRVRKKKVRKVKRQNSRKRNIADKENIPEKHVEQVSEAESFEYMPGHVYNQNQLNFNQDKMNPSGNKSSLESSAGLTTDSSKTTKYSFTKDLERGIDMLKNTLDNRCDDANLKKRLIKEVVQRLIKSKYKDDESSTEFLSGLTFNSKKLDLYNTNNTTTSTSEGTMKKDKVLKPKKSILRMDKFNSGPIASTSQSVPNLYTVSNSEKPVTSKTGRVQLSNTDSDVSGKKKNASDTGVDKTSSEQLYQQYLEALKREQLYKKHLKDKELFLKQKLVSSDNAFNVTRQADIKTQNKIKNLMKDLIRNNYDDGSGDASKLEVGSSSNLDFDKYNCIRKQRSHSVFTLSSCNSDNHCKQGKLTSKCQQEPDTSKPSSNISDKHYCCCPYHKSHPKVGVIDSSVQVDIKCCKDVSPDRKQKCSSSHKPTPVTHHIQELGILRCEKCNTISKPRKITKCIPDTGKDDIKYVCLCTEENVTTDVIPENILIYKCSRLNNKFHKMEAASKASNTVSGPSSNSTSPRNISTFGSQDCERKCLIIKDSNGTNSQTKSSQTDLNLSLALRQKSSEQSTQSSSSENKSDKRSLQNRKPSVFIHEATRVIQTEISIDPKISDPSISDINIVNDECCVQLISEQYKKVSQNTSDNSVNKRVEKQGLNVGHSNLIGARTEANKPAKYENVKTKETSTNSIEKLDKEIQFSPEISKVPISNENKKRDPNNFTIPIEGTNMTLKVSLGPENKTFNNNIHNLLSHATSKGTETVKNDVVDNFTSLQDECSKGVQSNNNNLFKDFYEKPKSTCCEDRNTYRENDSELKTVENFKLPTKSCHVNTCITDNKFNTYPKNDRTNAQKPLLRSNTDTGTMERSCRVTFNKRATNDEGVNPDSINHQKQAKSIATEINQEKYDSCCSEKSLKSVDMSCKSKLSSDTEDQLKPSNRNSNSESDTNTNQCISRDPLIDMIQDITKRYSKQDCEKSKRTRCFKEIITVLNYFLDTEESTDQEQNKPPKQTACEENSCVEKMIPRKECCDSIPKKTLVDKGIQLSTKKSKTNKTCTESSDLPFSTDVPSTSSDSATCKILNKIKRECEKYHQKRCKSNSGIKNCEASSSTSVNCDQCRRVHHCSCRGHKCKNHKTKTTVEKMKRKCVAYNLIIQTSDSVVSEEVTCRNKQPQLQNIIVKVPSKRKVENIPFKEMATKIERDLRCSPRCGRNYRSKSCPNESEISSTDDAIRKARQHTVREYLEKNRPDFVEKSSNRQHCLKLINETRRKDSETPQLSMIVVHTPRCGGNTCMDPCNMYCGGVPINNWGSCIPPYSMHCGQNEVTRIGETNERNSKRQLLSLQLDRQRSLGALTHTELQNLARELGSELRRKKVTPKFINEREMKKHSEKIYKSLPEVTRKKDEIKKENIKKTNLLMASIFKKNLQKKTLSGAVNLSNYSTVIKI